MFYVCASLLRARAAGQVGIRAQFDDKTDAFVATATSPIKAGTELLFYYGSLCREQWVNMYGFAPTEARPCRNTADKAAGASGKPSSKASKPSLRMPQGRATGR